MHVLLVILYIYHVYATTHSPGMYASNIYTSCVCQHIAQACTLVICIHHVYANTQPRLVR